MGRPMIGHRSKAYQDLHASTVEKLKKILFTENDVHLSASSATGVFEACVRNCIKKKALACVCGAFSKKWYQVAIENGKECDKIEVEWGKAIKPEMIDEKLSTGEYDSLLFVNNETSTGVASPLYEIAEVVKKYPDVVFMVDAVSSLTGMKLEVDKLGIDVCLAGTQKAFALPPGLAIFTVSEKAYKRAESVPNRGHYFDFLGFRKYGQKNQTPSTPAISQIYALNLQLERMLNEGMENRFKRHAQMAEFTRKWVIDSGFELFTEKGYESNTLTTVLNNKGIDVNELISKLVDKGMIIGNGYGELKNKTFRIAHMGDTTMDDMKELLNNMSEILEGEK
ncbi:MAG: alanine--glyoxylate aminotransferase family protein [Candidatus Aenigmarchaeota archaeon]|nr:alanine--glyoxylate aminotransferase family protein [Candidatus Aenigmarchaeota archaeon]